MSKSGWIYKQILRVKKFVKIWPLFKRSYGWRRSVAILARAVIMHGFVGFKEECRRIEKNSKEHQDSIHSQPERVPLLEKSEWTWLIWAPDYNVASNGAVVLYKLCEELRKRGINAFIVGSSKVPHNIATPVLSYEIAVSWSVQKKTAVVYPETVSGNPLKAKRVVRWVLNSPGLLGGQKVYSSSELVFYFSEAFKPYIQNKISGKLHIPSIDRNIFYNSATRIERGLLCYYVGKSEFRGGYFETNNCFEITRSAPAKTELGKLFRASSMLYCFDNSTLLAYEAIACGCPVTIIPDGTHTKEDYLSLELGTDGIIWGNEGYISGPIDSERFDKKYRDMQEQSRGQISRLVEIVEELKALKT